MIATLLLVVLILVVLALLPYTQTRPAADDHASGETGKLRIKAPRQR